MKLSPPQKTAAKNITTGYTIWLSEDDTWSWAHRINASWPCSQLADHKVCAIVDNNGLCDLYIDGKYPDEVDSTELQACIADHLPKKYRQFWPCWE